MVPSTPNTKLTYPLFPSTTLFRSASQPGSTQPFEHGARHQHDAAVCSAEAAGVLVRILADDEALRNVAAAVDNDIVQACVAVDADLGQKHRAIAPFPGVEPTAREQPRAAHKPEERRGGKEWCRTGKS